MQDGCLEIIEDYHTLGDLVMALELADLIERDYMAYYYDGDDEESLWLRAQALAALKEMV